MISKYTEPDDYVEGKCHCEDCEADRERARRGRHVRQVHGRPSSDVWDARLQKVVDRKNRMVDVFAEARV